jgi:hypothetical protein
MVMSAENIERKEKIASAAGVDTNQVRTFSYELGILRTQGLLVAMNIKGTSMFERKAAFDEYGIGANDVRRERLKTGRKLILPVEAEVNTFRSIATTLRSTLTKYSYSVPGFAPYKFVTFRAFEGRFKPKFLECQALWDAAIEKMITNLDGYRDEISRKAAIEAAKSWEDIGEFKVGEKSLDFEEYIDYCVARDVADIPSETQIRENMKLDYIVAMVYGDSDVAKDQLEAEEMRVRKASVEENVSLSNALIAEQLRTQAARNQIEEDTMRERRNVIMAEEAAHIRKQLAESGSPFDQIVKEARNRAADSAAEILVSVRQNGFMKGKVAEKGKGLLEFFDLMATHDDVYLMDMLKRLDKQIGTVSDRKGEPERDTAAITATLEEIINLSNIEFKTILSDKGTFSAIEMD